MHTRVTPPKPKLGTAGQSLLRHLYIIDSHLVIPAQFKNLDASFRDLTAG